VPGKKKEKEKITYHKQVCIYAFNKKELKKFYKPKKKSETENIEDIEILRFFDLGVKIKMVKLNSNSVAVDEKSDVKKVEKLLNAKRN
jgi:3-deoxy-manno-octulosonate cytidylyltransferase (CMP-KDO synthetase)